MSRSRAQARRTWLRVHLWLGLLLGVVFVLLGLTGSLLVFYNELDRGLNPALTAQRPVPPPSMVAVQQVLRRAEPQREGGWRVEWPLAPEAPLTARYYQPAEREGHFFAPLMLTLDPATLAISSRRFWGDYLVTWVYDLHYTFLAGAVGRTLVGWMGWVMALSIVSGLYLWWPSARRLLPTLRPWVRSCPVRACYDVHMLTGVYGGLILLVLCLTGTALAWPETTRAVLRISPPGGMVQAVPGSVAALIDVDQGVVLARRRFPKAEVRWVDLPPRTGTVLSVRLHQAQEPGRRFPKTQVWIDLAAGQVVAVQDPLQSAWGHRVMNWLHPLHNGEAFGFWGRVVVGVCGLVPLVLLLTGWLRWRQKSRARALVVSRGA